MAFVEYMYLIQPGIKALANLGKNIAEKKKNDGKLDWGEFWECIGKFGEDVFPFVEPIIRKPEEPTPPPEPPAPPQ